MKPIHPVLDPHHATASPQQQAPEHQALESRVPASSNAPPVPLNAPAHETTEGRENNEFLITEEGSRRTRGKWSVSPLWEAKILLGLLHQQGLAGKGLVDAFEKWLPRVAGCSRTRINQVYSEQTGCELSDYILVQQADKTIRYNQLPPEAEVIRTMLRNRATNQTTPEENNVPILRRHSLLHKQDPNTLLSTNEVATLTGFKPKTIRLWVSRRHINYIRVGNRLRFRRAAVELFLAQREIRK